MRLFDLETTPPIAVPHATYTACDFSYDRATPVHHIAAFGQNLPLPASLQQAVPKRQAEFLAGRLCAHHALARLNGPTASIPAGKDRAPQWPAGYVGSITHSDTRAAAIVGHASHFSGLGIDHEEIMEPALAEKLQRSILLPQETPLRPQSLTFAAFTSLVFSAKEALYKATYPLIGKMFGFHDVALLRLTPTHLHFAMHADTLPDWQLAVAYALHPSHCETLLALPANWPTPGGQNAPD